MFQVAFAWIVLFELICTCCRFFGLRKVLCKCMWILSWLFLLSSLFHFVTSWLFKDVLYFF